MIEAQPVQNCTSRGSRHPCQGTSGLVRFRGLDLRGSWLRHGTSPESWDAPGVPSPPTTPNALRWPMTQAQASDVRANMP